jgi:Transposase IS200 like
MTGRYRQGVLWSPSYFAASCGRAPLSVIAEYIKSQRGAPLPPKGKVSAAQDDEGHHSPTQSLLPRR